MLDFNFIIRVKPSKINKALVEFFYKGFALLVKW